jgi:hypothetical protein
VHAQKQPHSIGEKENNGYMEDHQHSCCGRAASKIPCKTSGISLDGNKKQGVPSIDVGDTQAKPSRITETWNE